MFNKKIKLDKVKRILIVRLSSIGDVVNTLPSVGAIRKKFPDAEITWAVEDFAADIVKSCSFADHIVVLSKWRMKRIKSNLINMAYLRSQHFDLAIDYHGLLKSGITSLFSGAHRRLGYSVEREGNRIFTNVKIPPHNYTGHALEAFMEFARYLECNTKDIDFGLVIHDKAKLSVDNLIHSFNLNGRKRLIAIVPGSSWKSKIWPRDRFAALADILAKEYSATIVIAGGKDDIPDAEYIKNIMVEKPIIAAGSTTLTETMALFERCDLVVGNDSGPMHIANAIGTPVVAVFGPTLPEVNGPYGSIDSTITARVPCSPCRKRSCKKMLCMNAVSVQDVVKVVDKVMSSRRQKSL